uniref:Uncharacterized protein n=1 Tax=Bartonella rochalimae ATCC BAA-1498 TaxID=685782 RepID=E6YJZ0_9HYPH|nr:hypothetical protein BARRO_10111 [Bartonella rochalimae ATCC BAA-1498]
MPVLLEIFVSIFFAVVFFFNFIESKNSMTFFLLKYISWKNRSSNPTSFVNSKDSLNFVHVKGYITLINFLDVLVPTLSCRTFNS